MNDGGDSDSQTYYDYIEFDETTDSLNGAFLGTGTSASLGLRCSSLASSQGSPSLSGVASSISGVAAILRGIPGGGGAGGMGSGHGSSHHHSRKRSSETASSGGAGARYLYGGVRHFLRRALKEVQFSGSHTLDEAAANAPATRPSNLESLCEATQLSKKDVKYFYRAFKQVPATNWGIASYTLPQIGEVGAVLFELNKFRHVTENLALMQLLDYKECPNGMASRENFREVLTKFFPQGEGSQYASYIFNAFDPHRKGFVTFEGFVTALSLLSRGSPADRLRWAFAVYDVDGDGAISRKELRDVIVAVHRLAGYKLTHANPSNTYGTTSSTTAPTLASGPELQLQGSSSLGPLATPRNTNNENGGHQQPSHSISSHSRTEEAIERHVDTMFKKLDLNQDGLITVEVFLQACLGDTTVIESLNQLELLTE